MGTNKYIQGWREARQSRPPAEPVLKTDGPTFEEYVAHGYDPASYPPKGYAEIDSPALQTFKNQGVISKDAVDAVRRRSESMTEADLKAKSDAADAAEASVRTRETPSSKAVTQDLPVARPAAGTKPPAVEDRRPATKPKDR